MRAAANLNGFNVSGQLRRLEHASYHFEFKIDSNDAMRVASNLAPKKLITLLKSTCSGPKQEPNTSWRAARSQ